MLFYLLLIAALSFGAIAYQQDSDDSFVKMSPVNGMDFDSEMASEKFNRETRSKYAETFESCMTRDCPISRHVSYICGTDGVTYMNPSQLDCANLCGKNVNARYGGACINLSPDQVYYP